MSAFTVSASALTCRKSASVRGRTQVRSKQAAVSMKPRGLTVTAFKVTLETPEGTQSIECADDTYILDAAEVRTPLTTSRRVIRYYILYRGCSVLGGFDAVQPRD